MTKHLPFSKLIPAVLWTAFIVYGLLAEPSEIPTFPWLAKPGVDKLIHVILFAIESGLLVFGLGHLRLKSMQIMVLVWAFVLGGSLELIQHFWIIERSGQLLDLLCDMVGAWVGMWLTIRLLKK